MSTVSSEFGGPRKTVYFSEEDGLGAEVLSVAVVWRCGPPRKRSLFDRLVRALKLDPLNRQVGIGEGSLLWSGSAGPNGEQETLFHDQRRVVRVAGREFPIPARGQTLVVLIDEEEAPPRVATRLLPQPRYRSADGLPPSYAILPQDQQEREDPSEVIATWRALLLADPAIAAFRAL